MRTLFYPITLSWVLLLGGCTAASNSPLPTVAAVDLERYSGEWIEIARYENRFERGCASASAEYRLNGEYVSITNRCYDTSGKQTAEALGRAYPVAESSNSKLEVTFFRPFYGDYWVLMLAPDYRYSVVGDPKRKYLWILARTPSLSENDKSAILERLPALGYDPAKLYWTRPIR
ncbi:MAG: lipocalin family protein [Sulfuricurvum sp.]